MFTELHAIKEQEKIKARKQTKELTNIEQSPIRK